MKKYLIIPLATLIFCACSDSKPEPTQAEQLTAMARKQMEQSIRRVVPDPNAIIENVKVMFESDSVTIIHCDIRATNALGGWRKQETEYIYGIFNDGTTKEWMANIKSDNSVFYSEDDIFRHISGDIIPEFETEEDSIKYFREKAQGNLRNYGKEIVND